MAAAQSTSAASGSDEVIEEVSIEKDGGPILLRVRVRPGLAKPSLAKAEVYTMLLDTGASDCCFDVSHRELLGEPVRQFASAEPSVPTTDAFEAPVMQLGRLDLRPVEVDRCGNVRVRPGTVLCQDLGWLTELVGQKVDGLLGMDVLRAWPVSIDFDEGRLRFQRRAGHEAGHPIPVTWRGGYGSPRPYVAAQFEPGADVEILVDTGGITNCSGALPPRIYDRLHERGALVPAVRSDFSWMRGPLVSRTGRQEVSVARARSFSLGCFSHNDVIFSQHPRVPVLGLGYLCRYFITFDFANSVIYLRPGRAFSRRDVCYDLTSLAVSRTDAGIVVESVAPGGRAAAAGIKAGDMLLAVNGRSTSQLTLFAIRRILAIETRQVVDIRRDRKDETLLLLDATAECERVFGAPPGEETSGATRWADKVRGIGVNSGSDKPDKGVRPVDPPHGRVEER